MGDAERGGFTLFELLLVLGILALLAGTIWPIAQWWYRDHALKQTAADLRVALDRTRIKSIDTGLEYEFRFEPGGRRFVALPSEFPGEVLATPSTASPSSDSAPVATVEYLFGQLPDGHVFSMQTALTSATVPINPSLYGTLEDADEIAETPWSGPIVYRTDGTTVDDRIVVVDKEDSRQITLELRGLTAEIRTSPVHTETIR